MIIKRQYAYFSAAIRDGAKLRPEQTFNEYFDRDGRASCASGAALEALAGRSLRPEDVDTYEHLCRLCWSIPSWGSFTYMNTEIADPPCGCANPVGAVDGKTKERVTTNTLQNLMVHLNNIHRWTREQIADWLYAEEEKLGFVTVVETEAHKIPEAGRGDSVVTEARRFVPELTGRF